MKIRLRSVARFTRQMSTYQDSFVDVRKALNSMSQNARDSQLRSSLRRVSERVNEGYTLFEAFGAEGNRYPEIFLRMTKVGEESGALAQIYRNLADYFDQQVSMRKRFFLKLIYPGFMVCVMILVHSLLTGVHAGITEMGTDWSRIEDVMVRQFFIDVSIVGGIIIGIFILRYALWGRSLTDFVTLYVPPLRGPFRKLALSRFSLSMYLMTGSAIGLPDALRESGKATDNAYFAYVMDKAAPRLEEGEELTPVLESIGLFPRDFIDIVEVAEHSGTLSESFRRVSVHYAEDAELSMNRLVSGLAWGIYLTMAGVMAYYIISLYARYVNMITSQMNQ